MVCGFTGVCAVFKGCLTGVAEGFFRVLLLLGCVMALELKINKGVIVG